MNRMRIIADDGNGNVIDFSLPQSRYEEMVSDAIMTGVEAGQEIEEGYFQSLPRRRPPNLPQHLLPTTP